MSDLISGSTWSASASSMSAFAVQPVLPSLNSYEHASANMTSAWSVAEVANDRCVELALEGERRCRNGDTKSGVAYLEDALAVGTDDLRTLSAVYSQLGNAYFYMGDYVKALEYHRHDLTLARTVGDRVGEAKASGNLGNTLKVLGKFDEAILCCQRHLDVARELRDKTGESRALYNIANVYHAKGKHIGRLSHSEAGEFPSDVRAYLRKAAEFYEQNLVIVQDLGDRAGEGRACGNLGNTYYLLGDFREAVQYHKSRLRIAQEFGDKPAMRRAYSNLGNAHVFLGEFVRAIDYYQLALSIAVELRDRAIEAQACYSLGNTCTLLGEHSQAIGFHLRHMKIARLLNDRVGQARAAWSLGNAYMSLGEHSKALYFVTVHLYLSREIGDQNGEMVAEQNWTDLVQILGPSSIPDSSADPEPIDFSDVDLGIRRVRCSSFGDRTHASTSSVTNGRDSSWKADEKRSKDAETSASASPNSLRPKMGAISPDDDWDEDAFFELLSRAQSKRMDDQRCDASALLENKENRPRVRATDGIRAIPVHDQGPDEFLEMVAGIQGRRMDDQRAALPCLPGLQHPAQVLGPHIQKRRQEAPAGAEANANAVGERELEDDFLDMLIRCQSTRIEEQRSELPLTKAPDSVTVPDDDFFQQLLKVQARRFDEQRADLGPEALATVGRKDKTEKPIPLKSAPLESPDNAPHKRTASQKVKR